MIQTKCKLVGHISTKGNLTGNLNNPIEYIYPELEDLTITPSTEQQTFKSNKYGYNNVTVEAIESEELSIAPSAEEQTYEGLYKKVTVAGDSDLIPENIKEGTNIFGVDGTAKVTTAEITNGYCLFYYKARTDFVEELLKLCKNVTNTQQMFYNCDNLTNLDLSNLDTSNVTTMRQMFYNCSSLTLLNLSNFNTNKVTDMSYMFYFCKALTNLDLSSFDTSNVTDFQQMFHTCTELTNLDLSNFNTSNAKNMSSMFYYCSALTNLKLNSFDISNVTSLGSMFSTCSSLTNIDLSSFNGNKANDMTNMFYYCINLTNINLDNFDASNVTSTYNILRNCKKLVNFKGLKNLGKGYTQKTTNYSNYVLDLSYSSLLTYESLISIINNLYDLNLSYNVANGGTLYTQKLNLGATNKAKLTAEEIAIATNKGWTVS